MKHGLLAFAGLLSVAFSTSAYAAERCVMSPGERAWVERSLAAWRYMSEERLHLAATAPPTIIVFDSKCRYEAPAGVRPSWKAAPHEGSIRLPDGNSVPAQVTSFASHSDKLATSYFVMALPSIWEAAKIPISADLQGLIGVFLHEFSHTRQVAPLKSVFQAAAAKHKMEEDFNDDSLQRRFKSDPAYAAVFEKESDLLYRAAAEPDVTKARSLAAEALALMEARQKRWFVGEESYWKNYDDLFLTMEGFGQWTAYAWLSDPRGGGLGSAAAATKMRGGRKWWSQEEGLGLFLVIDRFVPDWPQRAFASKPALAIDLLRLAAAPKN